MIEPVEAKLADAPLYSCLPRVHLDPDFQANSVAAVLKRQGYEGDARAAARDIVAKCQSATA